MSAAESIPYDFLKYQKNTFLHMSKVRNDAFKRGDPLPPLLYKKPPQICKEPGQELPLFWREKLEFSREWRQLIRNYIQSFDFSLKTTRDQDTPAIQEFLKERYPIEMAQEICAFDLHRFRQYGHGLVLEDQDGKVKGTIFELAYDTPEKTSYTIRLAVDESVEGKNLGYHLMMYSSLLAMEKGSRVKRGLIQFNNIRSLYVNLNKVGWVCDGFDPDITGLGPFFHIALPLDPTGLMGNAIDKEKIQHYLKEKQAEKDYILLDFDDLEGVSSMYSDTNFKVVALLPPGLINEQGSFFAIPADVMALDQGYCPYD